MAPRERGEVSLERALSKLGASSRKQARGLIEAGRVRVGGRVVRDPGRPVTPERATIEIDGQPARRRDRLVVMLNKPRGVLVTRVDPRGRPTIDTLLAGLPARVVPVGRLDAASTGLLLLTNDTRLADWLTDPRNAVPRRYAVTVRGALDADAVAQATRGIEHRGERLHAATVRVRKRSGRETHVIVELIEGKNREVRRLFATLGHEVTALRRVAFGPLELGSLDVGCWRVVPEEELCDVFPRALARAAEAARDAAPLRKAPGRCATRSRPSSR